ncbi:MAG: hypothetical protein IPH88_18000, partial [Bacteroidales bacterium]|nr:hypothetical protein [Bacteroidales bacterium]
MGYSIDSINTLAGTSYPYDILALNTLCITQGGTGGHTYSIDALNELCTLLGITAGHTYIIDALNTIVTAIGGTGTYTYEDAAWSEIAASGLGSVPHQSDALFLLDGTISGSNAIDKKNGWEFPLSSAPDWDTTQKIFPFRTAITISAPASGAAKTTIQAIDVNNFWYTSGGTPNQIPFISFFQNIDFADKCFSKHVSQTVNGTTGAEITPAGVKYIAHYSTAQTSVIADMAAFYGSEVEPIAGAYYISPSGNDSTGAGTKANPWKTNDKALGAISTGSTVYALTGTYDEYHSATYKHWYCGSTGIRTFRSTGLVVVKATQNSNTQRLIFMVNGTVNIYGYILDGTSSCVNGIEMYASNDKTITLNRCKLYNATTSAYASTSGAWVDTLTVSDCVLPDTTWLQAYDAANIYRSFIKSRTALVSGNYHYNTVTQSSYTGFTAVTNATSVKWCSFNVYGSAINISTALTAEILYNSFNFLYTSDPGSDISIIQTNHDSCIPTITYNTFTSSVISVGRSTYFINLIKCITPVVERNKFKIDSTSNVGVIQVVPSTAGQGKVKFNYNLVKTNAIGKTQIVIGGETSETAKLNESEFIGNKIIGSLLDRPTVSTSTTHMALLSGGKDLLIARNHMSYCCLALVVKSGATSQTYTKNGVYHNIFIQNKTDIWVRESMLHQFIITLYYEGGLSGEAGDNRIKLDENQATAGTQNATNIVIKNSILFNNDSTNSQALVYMDSAALAG